MTHPAPGGGWFIVGRADTGTFTSAPRWDARPDNLRSRTGKIQVDPIRIDQPQIAWSLCGMKGSCRFSGRCLMLEFSCRWIIWVDDHRRNRATDLGSVRKPSEHLPAREEGGQAMKVKVSVPKQAPKRVITVRRLEKLETTGKGPTPGGR